MKARVCSVGGCERSLAKSNTSGLCRSHRMKALNADPDFAAAHSERNSERTKALHASGAMMSGHICAVGGCGARLAKWNRSGVCSACRRAGAAAVVEAAQ